MKQLVINDDRGQVVAWIGNPSEFAPYSDGAKYLGDSDAQPVAWIDWIESFVPGNGSKLLIDTLTILEAEGVRVIGLEVVPKDPDAVNRVVQFYERFGFVDVSKALGPVEWPVMMRDASWNGLE